MPKLYNLAEDLETAYKILYESLDEDEVNPDALQLLNECKEGFDEKIAGMVEFIKRLSADYEAYKLEEERLYKAKKSTEKKIDWLKDYIKNCLNIAGVEKVETISCKVSLGKTRAVNVINVDSIPSEYKNVETTVKVDKKALAEAFKQGEIIPGAEYVENTSLRIK